MDIKAIIFDLDGVIFDTERLYLEVWKEIFLKYGYKLGLATSAKRDRVERMLNDYNIYQFFDVIVTGEEIENSKPSPEIYLKVMDKLTVKANNCLVIEDSLAGVEAGLKSGSQVIHIKDLVDIKNKDVISMKSILELKEYINKSN